VHAPDHANRSKEVDKKESSIQGEVKSKDTIYIILNTEDTSLCNIPFLEGGKSESEHISQLKFKRNIL